MELASGFLLECKYYTVLQFRVSSAVVSSSDDISDPFEISFPAFDFCERTRVTGWTRNATTPAHSEFFLL
jgi:hypothetical protein